MNEPISGDVPCDLWGLRESVFLPEKGALGKVFLGRRQRLKARTTRKEFFIHLAEEA